MSHPLTVLINAGPWLPVPPPGYGGIENVVATLVPALRERGVRVVLATVGESTLPADDYLITFPTGQFDHIAGPYNRMMGIAHAHMHRVVAALRTTPGIDLVHDHLEVVGPAMLAARGPAGPPALQTLHWDLRKHPDFYGGFDGGGRVWFACVSESQLALAPPALRRQTLGIVPLATVLPPAVDAAREDYVVTLGRFTRVKGQDVAARVCQRAGVPLRMAGPVAGARDADELTRLLAGNADGGGPLVGNADVEYYLHEVRPLEDGHLVRWVGTVGAAARDDLLRRARALLFPISWDEPGATAVVEALAVGTPIIGFRRGVLPSLIEHGVTGFLVDSEEELADCLDRVSELDPTACRRAAQRYSPAAMAKAYLRLYAEVLNRSGAASSERGRLPTALAGA